MLDPAQRFPLMALTQDGLALDHPEQARQLCAAGARWIQLRMKGVAPSDWLETARAVVSVCHDYGALCIVNDDPVIAIAAQADGVHLGPLDLDWREARRLLGPQRILGGTVNDAGAAERARNWACLDYVGVGPLRFTNTKKNLSPVLGITGIQTLLGDLGDLPAWVIGGVEPSDLPAVRAIGAAGVAVSSALFRDGRIQENVQAFLEAAAAPLSSSLDPLAST